jgi:hypothetical protein
MYQTSALKNCDTATPIGAAGVTIYTCPSHPTADFAIVTDLVFVNVSGVTANLTVYKIPNGGSAGLGNTLIDALPVNPAVDGAVSYKKKVTLAPGDFIEVASSVAASFNAFGTVTEFVNLT